MPLRGRAFNALWSAALMATLLLLTGIERAHAATFDGTWSVLQVCEKTSEGALGYTWRYDAEVKDGHLQSRPAGYGRRASSTDFAPLLRYWPTCWGKLDVVLGIRRDPLSLQRRRPRFRFKSSQSSTATKAAAQGSPVAPASLPFPSTSK